MIIILYTYIFRIYFKTDLLNELLTANIILEIHVRLMK